MNENSRVRIVYLGHRSRIVARITIGILFIALSSLGFTEGLPIHAASSDTNHERSGSNSANSLSDIQGQLPQSVGADQYAAYHIPQTVVSSVDNLIASGGVVQTASDNLTIYNLSIRMRLLGGTNSRDQLLDPTGHVLSRSAFWRVQVNAGGIWTPLQVQSSNFTILGTNSTGTFLRRTMAVGSGSLVGTFVILYKALSSGPLKWDLEFTPLVSAHYRFTYSWTNLPGSHDLANSLARFRVSFGTSSYTLSWDDVPSSLLTTPRMGPDRFELSIDLGLLTAGVKTDLDPSLVSNSATPNATASTFQRKVFYEPKGGYYFVFYNDGYGGAGHFGGYWYRYSHDGLSWSSPQWGPNVGQNTMANPTIFNVGQTVVLATASPSSCGSGSCGLSLTYFLGNITGPSIKWSTVPAASYPFTCNGYCTIQDFGLTVASGGQVAISYNLQQTATTPQCTSQLWIWYFGRPLVNVDSNNSCLPGNLPDEIRSALVPSDSQGKVRLVYQKSIQSGSGWTKAIGSIWLNGATNDTFEQLDRNVSDSSDFSATSTPDYRVHVVWKALPGNTVSYADRGPSDSSWTFFRNILSGSVSSPTITADYSTNDVYAFATNSTSILMRQKTSLGNWTDTSITAPVNNQYNPVNLGSNFASASASNSSMLLLVWTTGPFGSGPSPYNVTFAAVPIQTVWSAFSDPSDPWNGEGTAPYGQYFTNLGESVSLSTGLLSIRQTDLSLPGRGLDLSLTRIYTEPVGFLTGQPNNYENYPWAPMGNGWQLNFPWMNSVTAPQYIHLWNGEGYRIPAGFWTSTTSKFENHRGEDFILTYLLPSQQWTTLTTKSGNYYLFDPSHRLIKMYTVGLGNAITFNYDAQNRISNITDTIGRLFNFQYDSYSRLIGIWERGPTGLAADWVMLGYDGQMLTSVTDKLGRVTSYQYEAVTDPTAKSWLISRITYPTNWYTNYTYAPAVLGTEVSTFRVTRQIVGFGSSVVTPVRQFFFAYTPGVGDQVVSSLVTTYDGTNVVSYTNYSFSFMAVAWNVSDFSHTLLKGVLQKFGAHGAPETETDYVYDRAGGNDPPGSYSNYYRYDLWGNLIYSRRAVNPSTGLSHESFSAYYNDGLQPGFALFQDTFGLDQGTAPENVWNVRGGSWLVQNNLYNGSETSGEQADMIASADVGKADISIQATIYVNKQLNATWNSPRVGIFAHYDRTSTKSYKWALVLANTLSGSYLELLDEWNTPQLISQTSCSIKQGWYTFTLSILGHNVQGSASYLKGGQTCSAGSVVLPSSSPANGTGFGLYAGGYSAWFTNVTVTPVVRLGSGWPRAEFSNSFYANGGPGSSVHNAPAGIAELQNNTSFQTLETYYSDTTWGALSQSRQRYILGGSTSWLTISKYYDTYGNLVKVVDPRGNYTLYGYSAKYSAAYLTSENKTLLPGNTVLKSIYSYNFTTGVMTSKLDPMGSNTTYAYDSLGRVTRINYPTSDFANYVYNDSANYVDVINENGWKTRQIYDGLGRLTTTERFLNGKPYSNQTSIYNGNNQVSSGMDAAGNMTRFQYDALGRLTATVKPDKTSVGESYNDTGSWVLAIDQLSDETCRIYDRIGRLVTVIEYSDQHCHPMSLAGYTYVSNYYHDGAGNLVRLTSDMGQSTVFTYDSLDRLISTSYPDATSESYGYDSNSNLVKKVDRNGAAASYLYDSFNRATNVTYLSPTGVRVERDNYTYDNDGRLSQLLSLNATIQLGFDSRNRIINEFYFVNPVPGVVGGGGGGGGGCSPTRTARILPNIHPCLPISPSTPSGVQSSSYGVTYSYMGENLVNVGLTLPSVNSTGYTYDGVGRVLTVTSGVSLLANFSYYRNDQIRQIAFRNGLQAIYAYDTTGRPVQVTVGPSTKSTLSLAYRYNLTGTVASVVGAVNGTSVNEQFRYDPLHRLTNATVAGGGATQSVWYAYDAAGNRIWQSLCTISQTLPSCNWTTTKFTYNIANNELLNYTTAGSTVTYGYDADGSMISRNANSSHWTYKWDALGHLISVSNDTGGQAYYAYDALGRRLESKEGTSTTFYSYLGTETQSEMVPAGSTTSYAYANGMRIAKYSTYTVTYYHPDILGSTRVITDSAGKVLFTDNYQPFGQDNGTPTGSETYKFTGKPVSQTTGLYYEYSRWYDPSIGRFISQDKYPGHLSDPQSLDYYIYVENNPATNTDPTGMAYVRSFQSTVGSCPSFWSNLWGSFSCQLSRTPTPVADVVAGYDLAAWGITACWEDCGQLLSDAGSFLGGDTTASTGSDVTAISRTGPTTSVGGDVTIASDTTRIATADDSVSSLSSQVTRDSDWVPNPGGRLGGLLHRNMVNDIAEFIKIRGLTPDREYYFQSVRRFADVVALDRPGGNPVEIYQVGRITSQSVLPVAREIYAAGDILDALGIPVVFVPYNV